MSALCCCTGSYQHVGGVSSQRSETRVSCISHERNVGLIAPLLGDSEFAAGCAKRLST